MEDNASIWDIYFAGLVAMTLHPGFNRVNTDKPSIKDCAEIANKMMEEREKQCQ